MYLIEKRQKPMGTDLLIFSRKDGKKVMEVVSDFKNYFYVPEDEEVPDDRRITKIEGGHTTITGQKVKKIWVDKSNNIYEIKQEFSETFESDVDIATRYIIDELGEQDPYPLKILYFDIETDSHKIFPNLEEPDHAITSICMYDSIDGVETKLVLDNDNWSPLVRQQLIQNNTIICKNEQILLGTFITKVNEYDPDMISAWNGHGFDYPYLIKRMMQFEIEFKKLSPISGVYFDDWSDKDVVIRGMLVSDLMRDYMHFRSVSNQGKAESYSLEFTAQSLLGEGKLQHDETFHELWVNDPVKLVEYNMRDTALLDKIEKKLKLIDFFNSIRGKACSQYRSIYHNTLLLDSLTLRHVKGKIVLPDKQPNEKKQFSGAYVHLPTPGIYTNVSVVDVKSLYPNLIRTFNLSYETYNKDGEIQIKPEEGLCFTKKPGLIPEILEDLNNERTHAKNEFKKARKAKDKDLAQVWDFRQYAVKVLMNSYYGALGFPGFRLYKHEIAAAVTYLGQECIQYSKDVLEDMGFDLLYIDTDSLFFQSKEKTTMGVVKEGNEIMKNINDSYMEFANKYGSEFNTLEIEYEKSFKKMMFVRKRGDTVGGKKKYAYIYLWVDGKTVDKQVHATGFGLVRSDVPRISRTIQEEVLNMVLRDDASKEEVLSYIEGEYSKIKSGEYSHDMIGFPKELKNNLWDYGKIKEKDDGTKYKSGTPPIVFGARYCYDDKTEVLTNEGWKYFKNLSSSNTLATLKNDKYLEYQKPSEIIEDTYIGPMYHVNSKQINMLVTPNHKLYRASTWLNVNNEKTWTLREAKDNLNKVSYFKKYCEWEGEEVDMFILPKFSKTWTRVDAPSSKSSKTWDDKLILMDDWLEFLGYVISEGSIAGSKGGSIVSPRIIISQIQETNPDKYDKIKKCMDRLPFNYNIIKYKGGATGFIIKNRQLWNYLKPLGNSSQKHIPREFLNLSRRQLMIIYYAMFLGDGHITNTGTPIYTTISKQLSDDVQELLFKSGYQSNIRSYIDNNKPIYLISKIKKRDVIINYRDKIHDEFVDYNGKIYCATVPNHVLYVRRNGISHWSGNSNKYLGAQFKKGMKPKFLYVKNVPPGYPTTHVLTFEDKLPEGFTPDYRLLKDKLITNVLETIYEAAGFGKFPDVDKPSTTLMDF